MSPSGAALGYSTVLGRNLTGAGAAGGGGVAVDKQGNAYVTGNAKVTSTPNAYIPCSGFDGFLTVLGPAGNQMLYSTCLKASAPSGVAVDSQGRAYLDGTTGCTLTTTASALQPACPGSNSGFVMVLDTTLSGSSSLFYSSYLGDPSGSLNIYLAPIALDAFGKIYVAGQLWSDTHNTGLFPTTPGAYSTSLAACTPRQGIFGALYNICQWPFVTKLDPSGQGGNSLIYSTYLGYVGQTTQTEDRVPFFQPLNMGIAVDGTGSAYIAGAGSSSYPTTPGAFQTTGSGTFVTKLNAGGSNLVTVQPPT